MERALKLLQIAAIAIAISTPWIYFIGYTYDWGYLSSFEIDTQIFFKAPQEYFGIAYVVIIGHILKLFSFVTEGPTWAAISVFGICAVICFSMFYWAETSRFWIKVFYKASKFVASNRGKVSVRFFESVLVRTYWTISIPVISVGVVAILILLLALPWLVGFSKGQQDAMKVREDWKKDTCVNKNKMVGCIQLIEGDKPIAVGKMVATSDKFIALFDGRSVQIYSLDKIHLKTILSEK